MIESIRIDKYLWAIRMYKTRSLASEACKNGRIKIDSIAVKASREVRVGDVIDIRIGVYNKRIEILELIKNRVKNNIAVLKYKDITPSEEIERQEMMRQLNYEKRDRGTGRPTKKDRRTIDKLKDA
jgi:ribosome-associated heat shock protein Hsp15